MVVYDSRADNNYNLNILPRCNDDNLIAKPQGLYTKDAILTGNVCAKGPILGGNFDTLAFNCVVTINNVFKNAIFLQIWYI